MNIEYPENSLDDSFAKGTLAHIRTSWSAAALLLPIGRADGLQIHQERRKIVDIEYPENCLDDSFAKGTLAHIRILWRAAALLLPIGRADGLQIHQERRKIVDIEYPENSLDDSFAKGTLAHIRTLGRAAELLPISRADGLQIDNVRKRKTLGGVSKRNWDRRTSSIRIRRRVQSSLEGSSSVDRVPTKSTLPSCG